jgi:hypothetical protein
MKYILATVFALSIAPANASELIFQFNSPAFNGQGYSTHLLTIHQLEQQRKDKLVADEQAAIDRDERDLRSANSYRFQNNLESRIYAQLSRQIADQIFGEGSNDLNIEPDGGIVETPFGDTIVWSRDQTQISISISDSNGNLVSDFTVPIGEFAF